MISFKDGDKVNFIGDVIKITQSQLVLYCTMMNGARITPEEKVFIIEKNFYEIKKINTGDTILVKAVIKNDKFVGEKFAFIVDLKLLNKNKF